MSGAVIPAIATPHQWTLEEMIAAWLHDKAGRSHSQRTPVVYGKTLAGYRQMLQMAGLDLDTPARLTIPAQCEQALSLLATLAQGWAGRPSQRSGRPIATSTYNLRLAVVSSFYTFTHRRRMLLMENPIGLLERQNTQEYKSAAPLSADQVERRMAAIDRATPAGQRDYALLAVALSTGRRLSELAALRMGQLAINGANVTLTFPHAKGGKVMRDALAAPVADALLTWLEAHYGARLRHALPADAPVWVSLSHNVKTERAMSIDAIADVCAKRLGVTKVHTTRHTFAHEMEMLGAKVSDIQARLGHASLETTSRYLSSLRQAENPYSDALAARLGLKAQARPRRNSEPIGKVDA